MRKKYRELKRKGNVIVFPTTITRLLNEGMELLKQERYEDAREPLYQVLTYEPEHTAALGAYAYCLFELEEYEDALDVCEELLRIGPIHYLETMELYISLLMQLRRFTEAEQVIEALIEENVLPQDRLSQFRQLRHLSERINTKSTAFSPGIQTIDPDLFAALSPLEQEQKLRGMGAGSLHEMTTVLQAVLVHPGVDALAKTYLLEKLKDGGAEGSMEIVKFHYSARVTPSLLPAPGEDERTAVIKKILTDHLDRDPTRLEMAEELVSRHVKLLYPFVWDEYSEAEVAEAYMEYLDLLFSGEPHFREEEELLSLIMQAEQWYELRNG